MILTVLLNNLRFIFNVFVTAKHQFIHVMTSMFDFLITELIDKTRMKNNKNFVIMTFWGKTDIKSLLFTLQCSHCKKTEHEKLNCFVKHFHKKKKFNAACAVNKKKKDKKNKSSLSKFSDDFKLTFKASDSDNVITLSFMFSVSSHSSDVWIVNTETSDHLCFTWNFFLIYEFITRSLKMTNESAQIIEKDTVSLCLVCSDSSV